MSAAFAYPISKTNNDEGGDGLQCMLSISELYEPEVNGIATVHH